MTTGVCCATQAIALIVSAMIAGQLADRWMNAERALGVFSFVSAMILWVLPDLNDPTSVFLVTLVFWFFNGLNSLLATAVVMRHLPDPPRQYGSVRLWGTIGYLMAGWVVGAWLGNVPTARHGDEMRIAAVASILVTGFAFFLPATPPRSSGRHPLAPLEALGLFRNRSFLIFGLCLFGTSIIYPFTTQTIPLLFGQLGVPREWLGPILTVSQAAEILMLMAQPYMLSRLGVRSTMILGLSAWTLSMALTSLGGPIALVAGALALNGTYVAFFLLAGVVYFNSQAKDDDRASVQGLYSWLNGSGLLLGHLAAGWLRRQAGGDLTLTFNVGFVLSSALLALFLVGFVGSKPEVRRTKHKTKKHEKKPEPVPV
jgi:predicted MFS family arabinose efflux permease